MLKVDTADSILSLYNYRLPFPVAEYFCFAFRDAIVCNKPINYRLFKEFIFYKENMRYLFSKPIGDSNNDYKFIKLDGIEIQIPINGEEVFMDKYSNWIFTSANDVGLRWYDDDDPVPDWFDSKKYSGVCKLTF